MWRSESDSFFALPGLRRYTCTRRTVNLVLITTAAIARRNNRVRRPTPISEHLGPRTRPSAAPCRKQFRAPRKRVVVFLG